MNVHWCDQLRAGLRENLAKEPEVVLDLHDFYEEAFEYAPGSILARPFPPDCLSFILSMAALLAIEEFLDIGTPPLMNLRIKDARLAFRIREKEDIKQVAEELFRLRKSPTKAPRPGQPLYLTILCTSYASFYEILDSQYANGYDGV
jgi:hypothetical protein